MNYQTIRSSLAAVFSGSALALVVIAANAAMDQSRDANFEKEKLAYIRQYAFPKRVTSSDHEILFTKKESGKPQPNSQSKTNSPETPKESPPEALPPAPPSEGQ